MACCSCATRSSSLGEILLKAIVCTRYGSPLDALQLKDVEKPTPMDDQVNVTLGKVVITVEQHNKT